MNNPPVILTKLVLRPASLSTIFLTPCRTKVFQNLDCKRITTITYCKKYSLLELPSVKPDWQVCLRLDSPLNLVRLLKNGVVDEDIDNLWWCISSWKDLHKTTIRMIILNENNKLHTFNPTRYPTKSIEVSFNSLTNFQWKFERKWRTCDLS